MDYSDIFLGILIFLIFGILFGLFINLAILSAAVFLCSLFLLIFKKEYFWFLFLAVFLMGAIKSYQTVSFFKNNQLLILSARNEKVFVTGKVDYEPEEKTLHQIITLNVEKVFDEKQKGKILVYADKLQKFVPKEKISLSGRLTLPQNFRDFDYKNYLQKKGISGVIYYPEITKEKEAPVFWRVVFKTKEKLRLVLDSALFFPKNILLRAIILGDKKEIPDYLKESFNKSGIRHITAISGMHIVILMNILLSFLISIGIKRKLSGLIVLFFIFFYLFLIGFPASAVRAAIMGMGLILSQIFSRIPDSIRFLLFATSIMLIINPPIFYDIGFQLSFLAALGINYLSPFFNRKLKKIPKSFGIRPALSTTLSAQIFTLPVILYYFGYFSFLSPIANILVVPIMPTLLLMGILGIILGLIWLPLSLIIFIPTSIILGYIIFVSDFIGKLSFAGINIKISGAFVFLYYLTLFFFLYRLKQKEKLCFLEY